MKPTLHFQPQIVTLPSGAKVRARRPSVLSLIVAGGFPSELTTEVWRLINKEAEVLDVAAAPDPERLRLWASLLDTYIPHVLADPRIGPTTSLQEGDDGVLTGTLALVDIPDLDKQYIFLYGSAAAPSDAEVARGRKGEATADALASFRDGAERPDAGHGGEAVPAAAVESAGTPGA